MLPELYVAEAAVPSIKRSRDRLVVPARAIVPGKLKDLMQLRFLPEISGGARGFNQSGDVVTQTVDGRDLNELWDTYQEALSVYNAQRDPLLASLIFPVTEVIEDVYQGGDTVDFEEASEFGVPRGVRAKTPTYYSLAYSFKWWDIGIRFTWEFLAESSTEQVDTLNNLILEADNRNQFVQAFRQILNNVTRTATITGNNYNVYPLYNGDSTIPPKYKQTVHSSAHQHYMVSGATSVDPGDLTGSGSMAAHLEHHGYSWQEGSTMVLLVNSAQMATIRTFKVGTASAEFDFIPATGLPDWYTQPGRDVLAVPPGAAPPSSFNGMQVQGRYGPWLVIEDDLVPAGYMVGFASGGGLSASNLVGIREHRTASLRGLRLVKGRDPDYPLIESYYQRGFGTGIRQRGAGVVMQIKASGTYDIPAGYTY